MIQLYSSLWTRFDIESSPESQAARSPALTPAGGVEKQKNRNQL